MPLHLTEGNITNIHQQQLSAEKWGKTSNIGTTPNIHHQQTKGENVHINVVEKITSVKNVNMDADMAYDLRLIKCLERL